MIISDATDVRQPGFTRSHGTSTNFRTKKAAEAKRNPERSNSASTSAEFPIEPQEDSAGPMCSKNIAAQNARRRISRALNAVRFGAANLRRMSIVSPDQ